MEHVAIDLGGKESQICIRNSDGKIISEQRCATSKLPQELSHRPKSRVVMETCSESFAIAEAMQTIGHEVRVVPGTMVRSLGVGSRRIKTDRRDAQILSEVSCRIDLPSVHIRSAQARERKTICSMRDGLVGARTQLINTVRGWMRMQLIKIKTSSAEQFTMRVRTKLLESPNGLPNYIERQLQAIEALTTQITQANEELAHLAQDDETCRILMTAPGVGPITAIRFQATLDTISRFAGAHYIESYIGLTPSEFSSSEKQRRGSITKAGNSAMRWMLVQASWTLWRTRPNDPIAKWAMHIADRRGKRTAIIALSRKLAGILYAMWRDKSAYSPLRAAKALKEGKKK